MRFSILGSLEVFADARPVALGGDKQRALLALLLVHANRVLSSERIVDELWGEQPPPTAVKTLQVHISRLRKALEQPTGGEGNGIVVTREHGYELRVDAESVDALRFERLSAEGRRELAGGRVALAASLLEKALSLWRGPPLAEFVYERFAEVEIARLEELRICAFEELLEAKLSLGRHAEVVGEVESLIAEHPYRERLRAQLMLALYRSDRQAEALQAYQDARHKLVEELGIEPGERLRELERAILAHEAGLAFVDNEPTAIHGEAPEPLLNPFSAEPAVGRHDQIEQLRRGLHAAFDGRGVMFMIGGEAGIGKTRLADELARQAADGGARVVWGRCWEVGGAPAYWPWIQVLRSLLQDSDASYLRSFHTAQANALRALVPELGDFASDPASPRLESEGARFQLFDAVGLLLRESADAQPLVIVLDDLHAADTPSLLLLQFLGGQLQHAHVMLVGLYRDDDGNEDGALSACLAALARERSTRRMRLTGLSTAATASLIEAIAGREIAQSVANRIYAETEGNPLFVGEIVRLLEAEGSLDQPRDGSRGRAQLPDTVREVIGQRLRRLTPVCRRLLGEASILGREFGVRELAAVADSDEDAVIRAFDEATAARVLSESPSVGRIRFSHALIRDTLYEALPAGHRRAAHLRAGEALEGLHTSEPGPHLAELAYHFYEALPGGDPARAVDYAQRAGDRAISQLAYEEAARLYALALQSQGLQAGESAEKRCALLVALGDACARAGDEPAAREAFLQATAIAARAGLPVLQAQAALGYGGRLVWSRAYNDVHLIPLLEAALQALPADASFLRVRLMARLSGALRDHPSRERRASLSAQAVDIARGLGDPATLAYVLDGRHGAILRPETSEERLAIADEIFALAQQVADHERAIAGRVYRVIANMELGRMTEAETELEVIAAEAAALRQPAQLWMTTAGRANLALFHGRFNEAQALIAEALTLGERAQSRDSVLSHRLQVFLLHRETGTGDEVDAVIADAVSQFPSRPVFRCALACLDADRGHTDRAQAAVDELSAQDFAAIQRDNEYLFSLAFLADAIGELRDVGAAAVLYDLLLPYAHLNASNLDEIATGSVSRSLGALAATASRWEDSARHFDAAIIHNTEMRARPWVAHSEHGYGRMLLARGAPGDRTRAQQLLNSARDKYQSLNMVPWATDAVQVGGR